MKILVVYGGGLPNGAAMANRLKLYVKGLSELNNKIEIIIPHATELKGSLNNDRTRGNIYGVSFNYLSKTTERSRFFIVRRFSDFWGYLKLWLLLLFYKRYDIVFLIDIRNFWNIPICFICKFKKLKVIYELNEHPSVFSSGLIYWLEKKIVYSLFDGYILISNSLSNVVKELNENSKNLIVPILTEVKSLSNLKSQSNKKTEFILHAGSLVDQKEGIVNIIFAVDYVNKMSEKKIELWFTGNLGQSPDKKLICDSLEKLTFKDKIKFIGHQGVAELKRLQMESLVGVMNKPDNLQNRNCFPTKLGEYLCIAKPVIAANVGEYMYFLKNDYNAIILEEYTAQCLGENILKVLNNREKYNRIGLNGKITADTYFNYKIQAQRINNYFHNL